MPPVSAAAEKVDPILPAGAKPHRRRRRWLLAAAAVVPALAAVPALRSGPDPLDPTGWGIEGQRLDRYRRMDRAIRAYALVSIRGPGYRDSNVALVALRALAGEPDADPFVHYELGSCYLDRRDYRLALSSFERGSGAPFTLAQVGAKLRLNRIEDARLQLAAYRAHGASPEWTAEAAAIERSLHDLGDGGMKHASWLALTELAEDGVEGAAAVPHIARIAADDPSPPVQVALARALLETEPQRALALLDCVIAAEPGNRAAREALSRYARSRKEYAEALTHALAIVAQEGADPDRAYDLARLYARTGDRKKALDWLESALARGFREFDALRREPDLARLRDDRRYVDLIYIYDREGGGPPPGPSAAGRGRGVARPGHAVHAAGQCREPADPVARLAARLDFPTAPCNAEPYYRAVMEGYEEDWLTRPDIEAGAEVPEFVAAAACRAIEEPPWWRLQEQDGRLVVREQDGSGLALHFAWARGLAARVARAPTPEAKWAAIRVTLINSLHYYRSNQQFVVRLTGIAMLRLAIQAALGQDLPEVTASRELFQQALRQCQLERRQFDETRAVLRARRLYARFPTADRDKQMFDFIETMREATAHRHEPLGSAISPASARAARTQRRRAHVAGLRAEPRRPRRCEERRRPRRGQRFLPHPRRRNHAPPARRSSPRLARAALTSSSPLRGRTAAAAAASPAGASGSLPAPVPPGLQGHGCS